MLLQPLKVFAAAAFIALIIKDPSKVDQGDKGETKPEIIEQVREIHSCHRTVIKTETLTSITKSR